MKLFTCACGQIIFFESKSCTNCGRKLAFLPEPRVLSALEPAAADTFSALHPEARSASYRLCRNETEHGLCAWGVEATDDDPLCLACRLNETTPDLGKPEAKRAWGRLEAAKRRMLYTVYELGLPVESRAVRPENGLAFAFMESRKGKQVFTGQDNGLITINLDEANDPQREKIREQMGEAYRTLVGHFRHEIGHYYWDRLIRDSARIEAYRALFGDERADYQEALERHYQQGSPANWPANYVSAYATMHPWEDWAETWAHYLHMIDTLDTARSYGLVIAQQPSDAPAAPAVSIGATNFADFDSLIVSWLPLTLAMNSLDRSMGHPDSYPFVLSDPALHKLRFVHDVIAQGRTMSPMRSGANTSAATCAASVGSMT